MTENKGKDINVSKAYPRSNNKYQNKDKNRNLRNISKIVEKTLFNLNDRYKIVLMCTYLR